MAIMSISKQVSFLNRIGLPAKTYAQRKESWKIFQRASAWHKYSTIAKRAGELTPDGIPGSKTYAHVRASISADYRISPNFRLQEFRCRGRGHNHVSVAWELVYALQKYRAEIKSPVTIVTGYRCASYNKAVGGVPHSAHAMWPCLAADVMPHKLPQRAKGHGFHGIGVRNTDGNRATPNVVIHVDLHPKVPTDYVFLDA